MEEYKKRVLKFKFDGTEYSVPYPNNRKLNDFQKKQSKVKEEDSLESLICFLDDLGLPSDVGWDMEPTHLTQILEHFGQKKS